MNSHTHTHNLAARMGRWSARHRSKAIFGWLALMGALFAISLVSPMKIMQFETSGPGESGRADTILFNDFKEPGGEEVLIQSRTLTTSDPDFRAVVDDVISEVSKIPAVAKVESPLHSEHAGLVSADGHSALVAIEIRGPADDAGDKIDPILSIVDQAQRANPSFFIGSFGESTDKALTASFKDDLKRAGMFSVPLTLIILLLAFGALVAAGIPLLLALTSVLGTLGLVAGISQVLPMSDSVSAIVLLIGLAVGVDYTMFYLKREREERRAGRSADAALEAAAETSGRSVLVSGSTVLVAMAGMFLTGDSTFASFGVATMTVVTVAMLGSLTVLPALLSKLGDKVNRGRVPLIQRAHGTRPGGGIWSAVIDGVLRRPGVSTVLAGGLLVAIAVPAFQLHTAEATIDTYPQSLLGTYNRIKAAFPGTDVVTTVVVKTSDTDTSEMRDAITELKRDALATGIMNQPIHVSSNPDRTVTRIDIPTAGNGTDAKSNDALTALREDIVPSTVGALPDTEVAVGGPTAYARDFHDQMRTVAPLVFGFVLLFAFALMLVSFRSIVIAVKAVILNLLSVGAAYGVLVLVFQHGWGKGLLGFEFTGGIDPFLPILLFVILFGLSMDYHVFILSRVREAYDKGMTTEEAIAHGIKSTAGVVTSAAIVMVGVFAIFGTLHAMIFKQFGVGLAAAILIDATIIRAVLLPATMKLLGDWNWYLPAWLEWLPHFEHGGSPQPIEAVEPVEPVEETSPTSPVELEPTR
jgi:uncharacterized membrane protein YdfJ with MMPL/SSD domain